MKFFAVIRKANLLFVTLYTSPLRAETIDPDIKAPPYVDPSLAVAPDKHALKSLVKSPEKSSVHEWEAGSHLGVEVGSGVGSFKDLQVPINHKADTRADGRPIGEENVSHLGFPLFLSLDWHLKPSQTSSWHWIPVGLDIARMSAMTGGDETLSASYGRLSLGTSVYYFAPLNGNGSAIAILGGKMEGRRSSFGNVSTAHYIQSTVFAGSLGMAWRRFKILGTAGVAPSAEFGYSDDLIMGGHKISSSSAELNEYGIDMSWALTDQVSFNFGYSVENIHATIGDIREYGQFSLGVDDQPGSRDYILSTSMAKFTIRKLF